MSWPEFPDWDALHAGRLRIAHLVAAIDNDGNVMLLQADDLDTPAALKNRVRMGVGVLTDAASIAVDASDYDSFRVTLAGNRTLANPTGLVHGQQIFVRIQQDATGNRTLAYGSKYKFPGGTAAVLSTAASALDVLSCQYDATDDSLVCVINKAFA